MKVKDVELKTIGKLGGNVRIVSPTLNKILEMDYNDLFDDMLALQDLYSSIKENKFMSMNSILYFISSLEEKDVRDIFADARFYYETEFNTITFKEWCLMKNDNENYVPNILLIEGLIGNIKFENNNPIYIKDMILDSFEKKPVNALKKYDLETLVDNLYKKYIKYVKHLRTVHNHDVDEKSVVGGQL